MSGAGIARISPRRLSLLLPSSSHVWYQHQICSHLCVCIGGLGLGCDLFCAVEYDWHWLQGKTIFNCVGKNIFEKYITASDYRTERYFYFSFTNVAFRTFMTKKFTGWTFWTWTISGWLWDCAVWGQLRCNNSSPGRLVPGPSPRSAKDFYFDLTRCCLSEIYLYFPD